MEAILFSEKIKQLREEKKLLQRHIAAKLDIDTPMYSRIERGDRCAKREQVETLAQILEVDKGSLIDLWLADKVCQIIANEVNSENILSIVSNNISKYKR